jgi:LuxR family maltose regulon positive regulatory protein
MPCFEPLTEREREVLRLLAADASNAEIARSLVLTVSTVKTHVHNIFGKLGVRTRRQAAVKGAELRLL